MITYEQQSNILRTNILNKYEKINHIRKRNNHTNKDDKLNNLLYKKMIVNNKNCNIRIKIKCDCIHIPSRGLEHPLARITCHNFDPQTFTNTKRPFTLVGKGNLPRFYRKDNEGRHENSSLFP